MHLGKTKVMCNKLVNKDDMVINGKKIEEVGKYVYLGQMVTKDHDLGQVWSAFCKLDNIMQDRNVPMMLKRKAFNEWTLPVMTYGCETWSLSNTQLEKLITTQRKNHGRSHHQGQKEYKLNSETEWCNRHYHTYKRKQT